jgi:hypothetical protein
LTQGCGSQTGVLQSRFHLRIGLRVRFRQRAKVLG